MYLNPAKMSLQQRQRFADWVEANGCRDYVAIEPMILRGNVLEYQSVCRKSRVQEPYGAPGGLQLDGDFALITTPRRLRIRIPLSRIPARAAR